MRHYDFLREMAKDSESQTMEFPAEYMFKDVPNMLDEGDDPVAVTIGGHGPERRRRRADRSGQRVAPEALERYPDAVRRQPRDRPQRHQRRGAQHPRGPRATRHQGGHDVPRRVQPPGAGERPPLLPDLSDLHRPRHPDRGQRRHRRAHASRRRVRTSCTSTRSATTSPSCGS